MLLTAGDLFQHYRVIDKVGEGGMGVVYRAHDTRLGRDVALKFMTHAPRFSPELRDRLRREARALAALNHPNILTIHDIGESDGWPFLVLEWIDGACCSIIASRSSPRERAGSSGTPKRRPNSKGRPYKFLLRASEPPGL